MRKTPVQFSNFFFSLFFLLFFTCSLFANTTYINSAYAATPQASPCSQNEIVCENAKAGNSPSEWDIPIAGSSNIQGYTTQMSVNKGETVYFKINTDSSSYRLDIYRIGYYAGLGARKITTINPSISLPQSQPGCLQKSSTVLTDCGNWSISASWPVPADAVSGVYIAKLTRQDSTFGTNHIIFVVRDDTGNSDMLVQTSDATWQAYNTFGGSSLYSSGAPAGRAYEVSYNRPFNTRGAGSLESWFFDSEYPMIRWLEANGYDVSYFSNVDTAIRGSEILDHKVFLSVGHDEYWSNEMRTSVETARSGGINLGFFSGNEMFWKTRWANSFDGANTPFRTIICYKETTANNKIDPSQLWTGTWRDPRFSPPADGGRPENALTGTIFMVNGVRNDEITVPASYGKMRIWRNTSIASLQPGQQAVFPTGTLGYEWDESPDNGFAPSGLVKLSATTMSMSSQYLIDYGSTYGGGTATHSLTLYRHANGALVFSAGSTQWSWGLDATHDRAGTPVDTRMKQATVNLFADMRVQPATLQTGLVPASASTDNTPPGSVISVPQNGTVVQINSSVVITGIATDTGGVVGGVEISVDGGARWYQATGRENWQYTWIPQAEGSITVQSRAVDDSGNIQTTPASVQVTVSSGTTPADINQDGQVNGTDVVFILQSWLGSGNCNNFMCDLVRDGKINALDAAFVMSRF